MSVKDDVLRKLDQDIDAFIKSSSDMPANLRMKRLEHYTALRNDLDMMPLNAPQMDAMSRCDDLLNIADEIYNRHIAPDDNQPDFTELTYRLVDHIYHKSRMTELRVRAGREMEALREELKGLTPEKILDRAYEFTMKNEFFLAVDNGDFSFRKVDALLTFEHPLDAIYDNWLHQDLSFDSVLEDSLQMTIERQDEYLQRQDFIVQGETPSEDISVWNAMYDGDRMRFIEDETEENESGEDLEQ